MKKPLIAFALATPLLLAGSARSFPTGVSFPIRVEGNSVGTVQARNRVVDTGSSCRYTLMWTLSSPPLDRTVRCDILERKASNDFDCNQNARRWVTTLIQKTGSCQGFDEFGQQTTITTLTGGEFPSSVAGIFFATSVGDVQSFRIN
ncbi:MAG: hypothetical protein RMK29_19460 [Myxococcales bacterium]|nr:hypothetical protein [Myxococcota bacterium]MDW8283885.1 hypothetical protein [Myxococcales bacterium]